MNLSVLKSKRCICNYLTFLSIFFCVVGFVLYNTSTKYLILKLICIFIFTITLVAFFNYIFINTTEYKKSFFDHYKFEFIFIAIIISVYLPVLTNNYLFYDDYWVLLNKTIDQVGGGLYYARPINGIIQQMSDFLSFSKLHLQKWFSVAALIIFGLTLFKWTFEKSKDKFISFIIVTATCILSAVIDSIGYGATTPFTLGLVGSSIFVITFDKMYNLFLQKKLFLSFISLLIAISALLVAYCSYQLSCSIIFLFLAIELFYNSKKEKLFIKDFCLLFIFGIVTILYLLLIKYLSNHYNLVVSDRGQFIGSLNEAFDKVKFFIKIVIPQIVDQFYASVFGYSMFTSPGRINVFLKPKNIIIWNVLSVFLLSIILLAFVKCFLRNRRIIDILLIVLCIPMSYYTLFILKESSYVSYYCIPIISVLVFLFIAGLKEFLDLITRCLRKIINKKYSLHYLLICLIVAIAFQGNYYMSRFWVYYNQNGYNFVKNSIITKKDSTKWIHILGVLYPGQGNIYSVLTSKIALKEIGIDPASYKITTSDNQYYISVIENNDFIIIQSKLNKEEKRLLISYYLYDKTYNRYIINLNNPSQVVLDNLRLFFVKSGYLPENENDALIIDLGWVNYQNMHFN